MIKMDSFIISAFVTEKTEYENIFKTQLLPSIDKLGLKYHIEVIENKGSWLKNVAQKPLSILHAMEEYPSYNIVALDVDAEVLEFPKLFNEIPEEYEIAFHTLNWKEWYNNGSNVKEVLSGTLWICNNEKMRKFVKEWYVLTDSSDVWEQQILSKLILERKDIKVYDLPIEYCAIDSLPDNSPPNIMIDNPIIIHHQASRKYKRLIK